MTETNNVGTIGTHAIQENPMKRIIPPLTFIAGIVLLMYACIQIAIEIAKLYN